MNVLQKLLKLAESYWIVLILILMALVYVIVMILAQGQNVWFDEAYSITLAKSPVRDLINLTGVDAHPPLYYLYLKAWGTVFGWSEFALRSSSAVLGAFSIGTVAIIIRQLFSKKAVIMVIPFVSVAPFLLRYDYEIRMYALASLIGLVATWVLVKASTARSRWWWVGYAVLVALGMYTLYATAVIWLAHVAWLIVTKYKQSKSIKAVITQPAVFAFGGAVLLFAPYMPTFINQLFHSALPGIGSPITLGKLDGIIGQIVSYRPEWELTTLISAAVIALGTLVVYVFIKSRRRLSKKQEQVLLLFAALVVVPVVFYALSPFFIYRYMAHVAIYWYMGLGLVAYLGWKISKRVTIAYIIITTVLLIEGTLHLYQVGNLNLERLQYPMTRQVRQAALCDNNKTTVVADDPYTYIDSSYYFGDCLLVFYSKDPVDFRGGYAPLHDSDKRISVSDQVKTQRLVHLHWQGATPQFEPSSAYHIVSSHTFEKQVVDTYER